MSSTISSVRSSPIPDLAYDSYRSLSLRDQTLVKRQLLSQNSGGMENRSANRLSDSNMNSASRTSTYNQNISSHQARATNGKSGTGKSGGGVSYTVPKPMEPFDPLSPHYVVVDGQKYGLVKYSGESMAFWIMLTVLSILAMVNFLLTITIFGVLRLGAGMESIEFLPSVLKFYGFADLGEVFKRDGIIEGLPNIPVELTGDEGALRFLVSSGNRPSLSIDSRIINISQVAEFRIVDKRGKEIFSTNLPTLGLPKNIKSVDVQVVKANKITSPVNETLVIRSSTFAYLRGSEGTRLNGKTVSFKADGDIFLKSVNGSVILIGKKIELDVNRLALVKEDGFTRNQHTQQTMGKKEAQYLLCACMPEGKLFRVQIPVNNLQVHKSRRIGCHSARDPCK